jgi:LPXTG-site transpeptidase (sortase) family protein
MSGQMQRKAKDDKVPLSLVFITLGTILLLAVCAVWVVAPYTMPASLYAAVERQMRQSGIVPTIDAGANMSPPATGPTGETAVLLPESSLYPDNFVSAEEAVRRQPGEGEPAQIRIPIIDLEAPVSPISLEFVTSNGATFYQWPVPNEFRAGWHDNSALLGRPGNTVLNGHHNIHGQVFRRLVDLEEGDEIIVADGTGQTFIYYVSQKEIFPERDQPLAVRLENAHWIGSSHDERLTLVTCWPFTDNSHRLVIVARPATVDELTTGSQRHN